jgi:CubicO group peptidase (beta-lactamase class C family)
MTKQLFRTYFAIFVLFAAGFCHGNELDIDMDEIDKILKKEFLPHLPGGVVLIAKGDQPIFHRAYGMADLELGVSMRTNHAFKIGSIAKQFTAIAVLKLVETGRLKLKGDVRDYYPELPAYGKRITLEQILTHTSGLPTLVDLESFDSLSRQHHSVDDLIQLTKNQPLHFEPGQGFRYSDTGYILLGAIIERVSGKSYGEFLETEILKPHGIQNTYYGDDSRIISNRARGYTYNEGQFVNASYIDMSVPHGAGGLISTAEDLLKWDQALRNGAVIRKDLLQEAWSPRVLPDGTKSGYGYGWKICSCEQQRTIQHGGWINGFTSSAIRLPEKELNIIILVNNDSDHPDAGALATRIARYLLTGSPILKTQNLTQSQRKSLLGTYRIDSENIRTISEKDGVLFSKRNDQSPLKLVALSPSELTLDGSEGSLILRFEFGSNGQAKKMFLSLTCEPVDQSVRIE